MSKTTVEFDNCMKYQKHSTLSRDLGAILYHLNAVLD